MSDWIPTICMRCAVGCGHLQRGVDVGNGIDTVRGDATHPVNQGLACQRGVSETQDPDERALVAEEWGVPVDRLPDSTGPDPVGTVEAVDDEVNAVWTVATNPVAEMPDASAARERRRLRVSTDSRMPRRFCTLSKRPGYHADATGRTAVPVGPSPNGVGTASFAAAVTGDPRGPLIVF